MYISMVGFQLSMPATTSKPALAKPIDKHTTLLHQGMVIVGLPYSFQGQMRIDEITGGSPYGAATIAGGRGERMPSGNELDAARFQGRHVAAIAARLAG